MLFGLTLLVLENLRRRGREPQKTVTEPVRPSVDVGDGYPFTSQIEKSAAGTKK